MFSMIRGKTIKLYESVESGSDDFNRPIIIEQESEVDNVLIQPATNESIVSDLEVYGKHLAYVLHIPKGDTHQWADSIVEFYGLKWKVYGDVLIFDEDLTPLDWNKQVKVERYE